MGKATGERIKHCRNRAGMSRPVLGGLVGRGAEWVKAVETGRLSILLRIARALDLRNLAELTGDGHAVPVQAFTDNAQGCASQRGASAGVAPLHGVCDLSYQYLPAERQRFFRILGLHPGVDIDGYAAAALTGLPLEQASEHLDALCCDHLLDETVYRRYRMHDLIRDYARTLAARDPVGEREQALTRCPRPSAAASVASPGAVPGLVSRDQALTWLRIERANVLACLDHAARHAQHAQVVGLAAGIASLLRADGPWTQAWKLHARAVTAARHVGDRNGEATQLATDLAELSTAPRPLPAHEA